MAGTKGHSGGARPGAGAKIKANTKIKVAYKLAPDVVEILAAVAATGQMSKAVAIETAIRRTYGSVFKVSV